MKIIAKYECPTCHSTKEIIHDPAKSRERNVVFPTRIICGHRGCNDFARRKDDE